jgi:hypothetical protein
MLPPSSVGRIIWMVTCSPSRKLRAALVTAARPALSRTVECTRSGAQGVSAQLIKSCPIGEREGRSSVDFKQEWE